MNVNTALIFGKNGPFWAKSDKLLGVLLRKAREEAGLTQEELARRIHTKKTAISRIENHAEDMKLSTLEKFANALGKQLTISVA